MVQRLGDFVANCTLLAADNKMTRHLASSLGGTCTRVINLLHRSYKYNQWFGRPDVTRDIQFYCHFGEKTIKKASNFFSNILESSLMFHLNFCREAPYQH